MPRLLEEVRGQYNPTEEKQKSEAAAAKRRQESWAKMVSCIK